LLIKRRVSWGWFENVVLALVIGSIVAWKLAGPRTATIAATMGVCFAGIPGFLAMWKQPQRKVGLVWAGYVVANLVSFFGGTAMIIQERFAPGVFAVCSLAMFAASRRRLESPGPIPVTNIP